MKNCLQTDTQSVYQHGISVKEHTFQLIEMLRENKPLDNWKLPEWFFQFREEILQRLFDDNIIEEYTQYHDCGKPYCLIIDENGKRHFPNHDQISYQTWTSVGGNKIAAKLMSMDMIIHKIKDVDIDNFIKNPETITLLIVGLAEVHSNAGLFGGICSTSFKIKYGQINKRGKAICNKLFTK